MGADFPGALWVPGPNHFAGRLGFPIRYIIIHGAGTPETLDQFIAEGPKTGGVHYMIGKDGRVVQFVSEADGSWGNGKIETGAEAFWKAWVTDDPAAQTVPGQSWVNPNLTTISVEHEKHSPQNTDGVTPAQQSASFALIDYLCAKFHIPRLRAFDLNGGITGHASMEPVTRSFCPGPYPWDDLFAYLHSRNIPAGWSDDGAHLRPPD